MKPIVIVLILGGVLSGCDRTPSPTADAATFAATTLHFKVQGMTCDGCEAAISDAVARLGGVHSVSASHKAGTVVVTTTNPSQRGEIAKAIAGLNYSVEP